MAQSRQPWIRRSPSAPEVQNHSFSGLSCGRIRMVKPVPGRTSTRGLIYVLPRVVAQGVGICLGWSRERVRVGLVFLQADHLTTAAPAAGSPLYATMSCV